MVIFHSFLYVYQRVSFEFFRYHPIPLPRFWLFIAPMVYCWRCDSHKPYRMFQHRSSRTLSEHGWDRHIPQELQAISCQSRSCSRSDWTQLSEKTVTLGVQPSACCQWWQHTGSHIQPALEQNEQRHSTAAACCGADNDRLDQQLWCLQTTIKASRVDPNAEFWRTNDQPFADGQTSK